MFEESKNARKKRLLYTGLQKAVSIIYATMIFTLDIYFLFSSGTVVINEKGRSLEVGPLIFNVCKWGLDCKPLLFYMVTPENQGGMSLLLISMWVPLFVGIFTSRLIMWKVHPFAQILVTMLYSFATIIVHYNEYQYGLNAIVIAVRLIVSIVFASIISVIFMSRVVISKCFTSPNDDPIIVGKSYNNYGSEGVLTFDNDSESGEYSESSILYYIDSSPKIECSDR